MLTPDYLEHVSDKVIELYNNLEFRILEDIARRLMNAGTMTESARWQIKVAQESGLLYEYIVNLVASYMGQSEEFVKRIFEEASIESLKFDDAIYKKLGLNPIPIKQSESMLNILTSTLRNTNQQLYNLTMTTALSAQQQFINACNSAYIDVTSGAFDYNTAIFNAINQIGGLDVIYPSGYKSKIDVAVRRAVLTGVSQATGELQLDRAKEMGCKYVETSAHIGARNVGTGPANHEEWQGRVFQLEGSDKYPNFYEETGYGTIEGLCGINCRHSFFPFYEGISKRAYTDEELKEINNKKVKYNNKEMSVYEATQIQRKAERNIRADKRELAKLNGIIKSETNQELQDEARKRFAINSVKLKEKERTIADFTKQTGLYRYKDKETLKNYNKSISKIVINNSKELEKRAEILYNLGSKKDNIEAYLKDNIIREHILSSKTNKTINIDKQNRHIKGTKEFKEGNSYLTISVEEAQDLINKYAGTGKILRDRSERYINKELNITDRIIGKSVNLKTKEETETNRFKIHYSKTGVHIVPTLEGSDKK